MSACAFIALRRIVDAYARCIIRNEDAERDCDTVLRIDRKNVKGYFRRGQARVALQKLREAEAGELCRSVSPVRFPQNTRRADFTAALELEPANDAVKQELKKVRDALKATLSVQKTVSGPHTSANYAMSPIVYIYADETHRDIYAASYSPSSKTSTRTDRHSRA